MQNAKTQNGHQKMYMWRKQYENETKCHENVTFWKLMGGLMRLGVQVQNKGITKNVCNEIFHEIGKIKKWLLDMKEWSKQFSSKSWPQIFLSMKNGKNRVSISRFCFQNVQHFCTFWDFFRNLRDFSDFKICLQIFFICSDFFNFLLIFSYFRFFWKFVRLFPKFRDFQKIYIFQKF